MSDNTVYQRNKRDVAIELLKLHLEHGYFESDEINEEMIAGLYKNYYNAVCDVDIEN
ncbi:hypothetical protein [Clostridium ihumii]|uniref:hypothetical protein n=1 Tax=Clostridium ihumii TaxID=1470356 RepID=UPI003D34CC4F